MATPEITSSNDNELHSFIAHAILKIKRARMFKPALARFIVAEGQQPAAGSTEQTAAVLAVSKADKTLGGPGVTVDSRLATVRQLQTEMAQPAHEGVSTPTAPLPKLPSRRDHQAVPQPKLKLVAGTAIDGPLHRGESTDAEQQPYDGSPKHRAHRADVAVDLSSTANPDVPSPSHIAAEQLLPQDQQPGKHRGEPGTEPVEFYVPRHRAE